MNYKTTISIALISFSLIITSCSTKPRTNQSPSNPERITVVSIEGENFYINGIPTLQGKTTIRVPPGTKSGQKFRLRSKGAPKVGKKVRGDQFVEVSIVPPPFDNERIRQLMREIDEISHQNPREKSGMS